MEKSLFGGSQLSCQMAGDESHPESSTNFTSKAIQRGNPQRVFKHIVE